VFGFLNVRKPSGPTSHDMVAGVRRRLGRGVKVGHAGTLDPFADGVLVVCVGPATRLAEHVQALPKRYVAEVVLGATSTTDDAEGQVTPTPGAAAPTEQAVRAALGGLVGEILQRPPAHSAVHVAGRRAYRLARAGQQVDLPPRPVSVHAIEPLGYEYPRLRIDVRCGTGTYVRALARDVGQALGVGGYCSALTRTEVGPFRLGEAVGPDELDPARDLLDPLTGLAGLSRVAVDDEGARRLALGKEVRAEPCPAAEGQDVAAVDARGRLVAIARAGAGGALRPRKVFARP